MLDQLKITVIVLVFACVSAMPVSLNAQAHLALSKGQTVYVPAYSHIFTGGKKRPFTLAITLSIRNVDPETDITLSEVHYYGSEGQRIKACLPKMHHPLNQQQSLRFVIAEDDDGGGSGSNFIVKWESATEVNPPIIESIMIGAQSSQGISFTSRGRAIILGKRQVEP